MPVRPTAADSPPGVREWKDAIMECSGVGIIGQTLETFDGGDSGVVHRAGEPYGLTIPA